MEKARKLPVSPFMDRATENQAQMCTNFIDFIVAPLISTIVQAFPALVPLAENMVQNRARWQVGILSTRCSAISTSNNLPRFTFET